MIDNITNFLQVSNDFQLKNLWELTISGVPVSYKETLFKYSVKNVSFNIRKLKTETSYQGLNFYVGEEDSENTLTFEMYEYADMSTMKYLLGWRNTIFKSYYDKTGKSFLVFNSFLNEDDYIKNCLKNFKLTFQKPNTNLAIYDAVKRTPATDIINSYSFNFYNVKLIGFDNISLNYEDGGALVYSVTVQYDYYDFENSSLV